MKAIWGTCAGAMRLSGLGRKRDRDKDEPDKSVSGSKRAKGRAKKEKDTETTTHHQIHKPEQVTSFKIATSSVVQVNSPPRLKEEEGIFSSLPLAFFSPSVPLPTINLFNYHGGLTLPRLDPMELSYYFKSHLNEDHPFYEIELIFVSGPNDLLGEVMQARNVILHDIRWVMDSVKKGELVGLGDYVMKFPRVDADVEMEIIDRQGQRSEGKEEDHFNVYGHDMSSVTAGKHTVTSNLDPLEIGLKDHMLKYPQRTVNPSDFKSAQTLRNASFKFPPSTKHADGGATTNSTKASRKPDLINTVTGPSTSISIPINRSEEEFIPFKSSSFSSSSSRNATLQSSPVLLLPLVPAKDLDMVKVKDFERRLEECPNYHVLEDMFQLLVSGQLAKGDEAIKGIETGLLG